MTRARLLAEADSWELTAWQQFLAKSQEHQEAEAAKRKFDRSIMGDE